MYEFEQGKPRNTNPFRLFFSTKKFAIFHTAPISESRYVAYWLRFLARLPRVPNWNPLLTAYTNM